MIDDPLVNMRHVRAAKLCARGARQWFRAQPDLSWREFVGPGIPASKLEATGDHYAQIVAQKAREEANGRRR